VTGARCLLAARGIESRSAEAMAGAMIELKTHLLIQAYLDARGEPKT